MPGNLVIGVIGLFDLSYLPHRPIPSYFALFSGHPFDTVIVINGSIPWENYEYRICDVIVQKPIFIHFFWPGNNR